jgi:NADH dehydrogenase
LRAENLPVRALVRKPGKVQVLRELGVEVAMGDIADRPSLEAAMQGCDRVMHLVGIIQEGKGYSFRSVHIEGTRNVLDAAKKANIRRLFHQSALGTREGAASEYYWTKWEAEKLVTASGLPSTILRPSLIYGPGDLFTVRLSEMIRLAPVLPVIGSGRSKIQPIFIDDVVSCMVKAATGDAFLGRTYEIGGPEQLTYEEVTRAIADALGIKRTMVHMPMPLMRSLARMMETVLPTPPVTTDQLIMMQEDNVCDMKDIREAFGIEPVAFREGLKRFLRN